MHMVRRIKSFLIVLPLVGLLALAVMPDIALADDGSQMGAFSVFNSVEVGPNETVEGSAGSIFSSVNVMGHVTGDVFSIFSSVNIGGQAEVDGDVFSIFSSVNVSGNAVVHGSVSSAMSTVNKSPSARIEGQQMSGTGTNRGSVPSINIRPWDARWGAGAWGANLLGNIFGGIFAALLLAAIGVVVVVLMPRRVEVVKQTVAYSPWASLGVGFLGLILSVPLALVLLLTCIGFFVVVIGTFLLTLLGLIAIGLYVGQRVMEGANGRSSSPVMDVMVGTLIIALIMAALNLIPCINCCAGLIWFGLCSLGFGAVLLSRFGSVPPVMPAPPAPPAPVIVAPVAPAAAPDVVAPISPAAAPVAVAPVAPAAEPTPAPAVESTPAAPPVAEAAPAEPPAETPPAPPSA
jgi:hypothetical protein